MINHIFIELDKLIIFLEKSLEDIKSEYLTHYPVIYQYYLYMPASQIYNPFIKPTELDRLSLNETWQTLLMQYSHNQLSIKALDKIAIILRYINDSMIPLYKGKSEEITTYINIYQLEQMIITIINQLKSEGINRISLDHSYHWYSFYIFDIEKENFKLSGLSDLYDDYFSLEKNEKESELFYDHLSVLGRLFRYIADQAEIPEIVIAE